MSGEVEEKVEGDYESFIESYMGHLILLAMFICTILYVRLMSIDLWNKICKFIAWCCCCDDDEVKDDQFAQQLDNSASSQAPIIPYDTHLKNDELSGNQSDMEWNMPHQHYEENIGPDMNRHELDYTASSHYPIIPHDTHLENDEFSVTQSDVEWNMPHQHYEENIGHQLDHSTSSQYPSSPNRNKYHKNRKLSKSNSKVLRYTTHQNSEKGMSANMKNESDNGYCAEEYRNDVDHYVGSYDDLPQDMQNHEKRTEYVESKTHEIKKPSRKPRIHPSRIS